MKQVIYADVLVILNLFITYGLLRLTGIICRSEKRQWLLMLACFLSGLYSLVIIIPNIPDFLVAVSRLPVSVMLVLLSFKVNNIRHFLRLFCAFFTVNFVFAGLMFFLWYFFAPAGMYFNNGIVYFNISIELLGVMICICYFAVLIFSKLISFKTPVNTMYVLTVFLKDKTVTCSAFFDTGNCLKDVFTSYPIIILDKKTAVSLFEKEISFELTNDKDIPIFHPVICTSVTGEEMLMCFKPDKIRIRGVKCDFETDRVCVAITDKLIKNGEYSALLGSEIFQNKTNETGDCHFSAISQKIFK